MKGLSDMEFKFEVNDTVTCTSDCIFPHSKGKNGIIKTREFYAPYGKTIARYLVELPISDYAHEAMFCGKIINGVWIDEAHLAVCQNGYVIHETNTKIEIDHANLKPNNWRIEIYSGDTVDSKDRTILQFFVNGKFVEHKCVERYHDDEYDVGVACAEVIKRMFGDRAVASPSSKNVAIEIPPYNQKVVCITGSEMFTQGVIYEIKDGVIKDDDGVEYYKTFINLDDLNNRFSAKFIELVERG